MLSLIDIVFFNTVLHPIKAVLPLCLSHLMRVSEFSYYNFPRGASSRFQNSIHRDHVFLNNRAELCLS